MRVEFENLEKARAEIREGFTDQAALHATKDFELLLRLMCRITVDDATPQRLERRCKKIPVEKRPSLDLVQRLLELYQAATCIPGSLSPTEVMEFIEGMEGVIRKASADSQWDLA